MSEWTDAQIQAHFLADFNDRFHAENAAWRAMGMKSLREAGIVDTIGYQDKVRDSFLFALYQGCLITWKALNWPQILPPKGFSIDERLLDIINTMELHWGNPSFGAVLVDGEPRLVIDCMLVDYWDDKRHEIWMTENYEKALKKCWSAWDNRG